MHITVGMNRAGAETFLMNLFRNLNKNKFQFDFVYVGGGSSCDYDDEIEELGGKIYRVDSNTRFKVIRNLKRLINYYRLLKNLPENQIIHSHINFNGALFLLIARILNKKVRISHSHNTLTKGKRGLNLRLYEYFCRSVIKSNANVYMACGIAAGKYMFPSVEGKKIVVFPNAIDLNYFQEMRQNQNFLKEKLNLPNSMKIIVQIGRFELQKNFEFTIKLAEYLLLEDSDIHFVFVGTGPMEKELKELVESKAIEKNITFFGISSEIPKILHSSDLFLMPSRHEGFPVVLVEAQACGIPCLISENISNEVDMGLNLIYYASLEKPLQEWKKEFYKAISHNSLDLKTILKKMKARNFDVLKSVRNLEALYSNSIESSSF